jgi:hypothetical protein
MTSLIACNRVNTDLPLAADYDNGVFVACEGKFPDGEASLTYKSFKDGKVIEDVVKNKYNTSLGLLAQSVNVFDNQIFVCLTNSNRVVRYSITDLNTLPYISVNSPRYSAKINSSKYYISDWGSPTDTAGVNVYDVNTSKIIKRIKVKPGAEEILLSGNRAYITCNGGFGNNNTVAIINTDNDDLLTEKPIGPNPDGIVKDVNNNIWILCTGQYDANWNLASPGTLVRLNALTNKLDTVHTFTSAFSTPSNLKVNKTGDQLFMNFGGNVLRMGINESQPTAIINGNFYGLAVDANGDIYAADAKDFASKGQVKVYSSAYVLKDSFATGVAPNDILIYRK